MRVADVQGQELHLDVFVWGSLDRPLPEAPEYGAWTAGALLQALADRSHRTRLLEDDTLARVLMELQAAAEVSYQAVPSVLEGWVASWSMHDATTHLWSAEHGVDSAEGTAVTRATARLRIADSAPHAWAALLKPGVSVACFADAPAFVPPSEAPTRPDDEALAYLVCSVGSRLMPVGSFVRTGTLGYVWALQMGAPPTGRSTWAALAVPKKQLSSSRGPVTVQGGWVEMVGSHEEVCAFVRGLPGAPAEDALAPHMVKTGGDGETVVVGLHGTATVGRDGVAEAGDHGTAVSGHRGRSTAGLKGSATSGMKGVSVVGDEGVATAGPMGQATAGREGVAVVGKRGVAQAGVFGHVAAGAGGRVRVELPDGSWMEETIGAELKPDVHYRYELPGSSTLFPSQKPGWVETKERPASVRARRKPA